jgi:hypothetical protein
MPEGDFREGRPPRPPAIPPLTGEFREGLPIVFEPVLDSADPLALAGAGSKGRRRSRRGGGTSGPPREGWDRWNGGVGDWIFVALGAVIIALVIGAVVVAVASVPPLPFPEPNPQRN